MAWLLAFNTTDAQIVFADGHIAPAKDYTYANGGDAEVQALLTAGDLQEIAIGFDPATAQGISHQLRVAATEVIARNGGWVPPPPPEPGDPDLYVHSLEELSAMLRPGGVLSLTLQGKAVPVGTPGWEDMPDYSVWIEYTP
jgi:hypothetical protein